MEAVIVRTDLAYEVVEFTEDTFLEVCQKAVGGYIEAVNLGTGLIMWVNEEGLLTDLDFNPLGSEILAQLGQRTGVRGDIIFTGAADEEGNVQSIDAQDLQDIKDTCDSVPVSKLIM